MSAVASRVAGTTDRTRSLGYRLAALAGVALVTGSYLSVLYHVTDVVGGVGTLLVVTAAAAALGLVLGSTLTDGQAIAVASALLVAGLGWYLLAVPPSFYASLTLGRVVGDQIALLTGYSVLQMIRADVWAISVAPGPTFLVAYFVARNEYVRSASVAAATLGFFVLTGDSGTIGTLLGTLGAAAVLGFESIERHGGRRDQVEVLAIAFAAMILASVAVTAVPASEGSGDEVLAPGGSTVKSDLVSADERTPIGGSIQLSPKVRFVVDAGDEQYWRAAAYDRFTGSSWVRTGDTESVDGTLDDPPGPRRTVNQTYEARSTVDVLLAAAEPVRLSGTAARITAQGTLESDETLQAGDEYSIVSRVPNATTSQLRAAGTDYPDSIAAQYLELPESTPARVGDLAANVTENATNPYDAAANVERYLETNKEYSTSVSRPDGNIADSFLFEMQRGYCTYYATAMTVMLRSQGIPARFVVGYAPGQRVAEDEWVLRGLDSHAWVEVYFPEYGWVRFDPTPADPRREAERNSLDQAREDGVEGIEAAGSENGTWTTTATPADDDQNRTVNGTNGPIDRRTTTVPMPFGPTRRGDFNGTAAGGPDGPDDGGGEPFEPPPPETMALWGLIAVGLAAGARRSGLAERAYRAVWLRWQPSSGDPNADIEAAFDRVEYVLGRHYRPREPDETVREYLQAIDADERAYAVANLRERAIYAGDATAAAAADARQAASALVSDKNGLATVFNRLLS